jgi:hypothetical protein
VPAQGLPCASDGVSGRHTALLTGVGAMPLPRRGMHPVPEANTSLTIAIVSGSCSLQVRQGIAVSFLVC